MLQDLQQFIGTKNDEALGSEVNGNVNACEMTTKNQVLRMKKGLGESKVKEALV